MGELEPWMDENFIKNVFSTVAGETVNVKVIRDRNSGYVASSYSRTYFPLHLFAIYYTALVILHWWLFIHNLRLSSLFLFTPIYFSFQNLD